MPTRRLWKSPIASVLAAALVLSLPLIPSGDSSLAQPAPSFQASCGELRQAIEDLNYKDGELVTIAVSGELTIVGTDGALIYLGMCKPPDPQVICVTYETNGRKVGDTVIVTGGYVPRGRDYIQLDPCLHHLPE